MKYITLIALALALAVPAVAAPLQEGQSRRYPGQFAQDWEAGGVPSDEDLAELEREVAAKPDDYRLVRRLAKGIFFQYFGGHRAEALPKARTLLERVLTLHPDDAESMAYLASLDALEASRSPNAPGNDAKFLRARDMLKRALELAPTNGAVLAVSAGSFLMFPDSYGTVPISAALVESIRKHMGPAFYKFSHHGQQRLLLTQGQAYARMGQPDKARICFDEGLAVNPDSYESGLLDEELKKLPAKTASAGK